VVVATIAAACADGSASGSGRTLRDDAITVGSFNFPESVLLAELYAQALEGEGIRVERRLGLGPRELVQPALQRGLLELVPEYAGSLLVFLVGGSASASLEETREELASALDRRGLAQLGSSPAQDRNGFAVTAELAGRLGATALSDLGAEPDLVLGAPLECEQRPLCLPGLEGAYGLEFSSFVPLDQSGPITSEALLRGVVDLALFFTTSAELDRHDFVLLEDDRHLQPAENVTPVVHRGALERFGFAIPEAVNPVSALLTTEELRSLNAAVEIDGRDPAAVARAWLVENGLVDSPG
jgi:osmoprotectant transport system substrate-binding protein